MIFGAKMLWSLEDCIFMELRTLFRPMLSIRMLPSKFPSFGDSTLEICSDLFIIFDRFMRFYLRQFLGLAYPELRSIMTGASLDFGAWASPRACTFLPLIETVSLILLSFGLKAMCGDSDSYLNLSNLAETPAS
jgi:hypothetical protein